MKFIVSSGFLKQKLKPLKKVINHSTVLPILECFLVEATAETSTKSGSVTMSATDLESYMSVSFEAEVRLSGSFCLSSRELYSLLLAAPDQPIIISVSESKDKSIGPNGPVCQITGDEFKVTLPAESADNYPKVPVLEKAAKKSVINASAWMEQMRRAIPFVSRDDLRPAITGVFINATTELISIAATDAHRLYWNGLPPKPGLTGAKAILPAKAVRLLLLAAPKFYLVDAIEITVGEKHTSFSFYGYTIITRNIEARYPDYSLVIPQTPFEFSLIRSDAIRFLNLVRHFTNACTGQTSLVISSKEQSVMLEGADVDFSFSATARLNAYNFNQAQEITIALNVNFLLETLKLDKDNYVRIQHCGSPTKAVVVDNNILLMPLMLNQ